jgi:hypothetical protein
MPFDMKNLPPRKPLAKRPAIDPETIADYLDWIASCIGELDPRAIEQHTALAELAVRTTMGAAQAKATQHTLVEQGVIAPPPTAS